MRDIAVPIDHGIHTWHEGAISNNNIYMSPHSVDFQTETIRIQLMSLHTIHCGSGQCRSLGMGRFTVSFGVSLGFGFRFSFAIAFRISVEVTIGVTRSGVVLPPVLLQFRHSFHFKHLDAPDNDTGLLRLGGEEMHCPLEFDCNIRIEQHFAQNTPNGPGTRQSFE